MVLDYQLEEHLKFLDKFNSLFKQVDLDTNGILTQSEFRELMYLMDLFEMDKQSPTKKGGEEGFKLTSFETEHLI